MEWPGAQEEKPAAKTPTIHRPNKNFFIARLINALLEQYGFLKKLDNDT
jgi:hypothetical protein